MAFMAFLVFFLTVLLPNRFLYIFLIEVFTPFILLEKPASV